MKLVAKILLFIIGWKLKGLKDLSELKKSVILFAPHTSFCDGFIGKIFFWRLGLEHRCLMTKKYFYWYTSPFLKFFGFVPVGGIKGHNAILEATEVIEKGVSVLVCPEGHLRAVEEWNPGVYLIAKRAEVPILFAFLDYKNKEGGILDYMTLREGEKWDSVKERVRELYKPEMAKYPEKFLYPK